jgi:hypothetical protein
MSHMSADTSKITDRIMKLLAKAEGTDNEAEAATFMEAAQRLMAQHAIEESMVRAAGRRAASEVVTKFITSTHTWHNTDLALAGGVTDANDCQVYGCALYRGQLARLAVVGHPEDVDNVFLAYGSLQIQLARYLRGTPSHQSWRRAFRYGFANRVTERLAETRAHIVREMAEDDPSLLPVLRDKAAAVRDAMPDNLRKVRNTRVDAGGYESGTAAGNRADVGGPAMPSGARALGR